MIPTPAASATGHDLVVRGVAAHGLAGSMLSFPDFPFDDPAFNAMLSRVKAARITGLLWHAVAEGDLPVTVHQADRAEQAHIGSLCGVLVLERLLIDTVDCLEAGGVPVRVLKGTAAGHLDYPSIDLRTFGDIDLLVPGDAFDTAVTLLSARGHRRQYPQPRPGFDRRFGKGTSFRTADGLEIDLHRTFTMGPFGVRLDVGKFWERSNSFHIGDRRLEALATEERLVHACYHAVLGETRPKLTPLRDVAQIALHNRLDHDRLHDLMRSGRAAAVVAKGLRLAWSEFQIADVTALSAWAHAYRSDRREDAEIAAYGVGSSYASKSVAALRALPSLSQRASFLFALVAPTGSYLGNRHPSRVSRLRAGLQQGSRARRVS